MSSEAALRALFSAANQGHVFAHWDACSAAEQAALLAQLREVDPHAAFRALPAAAAAVLADVTPAAAHASEATASPAELAAWEAEGLAAVAAGQVAVVLLAGGQGTRLGSPAPKGLYDIGLPSRKSLFQLQAERLAALRRLAATRAGVDPAEARPLPWYVMTSAATRDATAAFFQAHAFFGLPPADVVFFDQGALPCLDPASGAMLLESRCRLATAPDGNGGVFPALRRSGALAALAAAGVTCVHVCAVDNALVTPGDPVLVGFCRQRGALAGARVVPRAGPAEAVGVFARGPDGAARVVEYSELPGEAGARRDPRTGALAFNAANIALHYFTLPFLQAVAAQPLPYHAALKKVPVLQGGEPCVAPSAPNGLKLEAFVFDVYPATGPEGTALLEGTRGADFAPVKNAEGAGADSPDTARALVSACHARWARAAGATVLGGGLFELAPRLTLRGEGLEALRGRSYQTPCCVSE